MGSRKTVKVSLAPRPSAISRKQSASVTKARRGVAWSGGSGFEGSSSMETSDAFGFAVSDRRRLQSTLSKRVAGRKRGKGRRERRLPPLALEAAAHAGLAECRAAARRDRLHARAHLVEVGFARTFARIRRQ